MNESWVDVVGYEGLYEVSDLGRVKNIKTGRILKPWNISTGYLLVSLCKNGIVRKALIHRLVATAFLPNPQNLPEVNHRDENKSNNAVENLEWCTHDYNMNYGTIYERLSKPVLQFNLQGNLIKEWPSVSKVEEEMGITHISDCCLGRYGYKTAKGFIWRYKN